ncbi:P-loop containing nucleoside triphosphate hydrolase protein [Crassisporium funariophilum]|nr:P-loop containing nucleoside triphosphate hydrolase protein [Crassisporium funariophilum]
MSGCSNTTASNGTLSQTSSAFPTDLTSLFTFLVSFSALRDWLKLIVLGGVLETFRRLAFHLYYKLYNSFFITARFDEDDSSYDWMMVFLSDQPSWRMARDVQVSTRSYGLNSSAVMIEGEPEDPMAVMSGSRPLAYVPSTASTHSMWYKGHWMRVSRSTKDGGYYGHKEDILEICILSWNHTILNRLLLDAKKAYKAAQETTISIFVSDSSNNWRHIASRPKRPLTSIVLDPGIKDLLMDDARDFLESKGWYSARGIPFRRGYLLYGAPGSGKTSIIHSLAGELGLDVYVVSLSRVGLDDTALSELISDLPEKCIALMEDIDAAFSQTVNRDEDDAKDDPTKQKDPNAPAPRTTSSLSGLLNALDGVGAQEGRILFATTNKYASLDSALCRPGRMDIHIEFKLASQFQAQELYRCFYLPDTEEDKEGKETGTEKSNDNVDSGYSSDVTVNEKTSPTTTSSELEVVTPSEPTTLGDRAHRARAPKLSRGKINALAARFSAAIPEREFSMASLQGYLMAYKVRPYEAVEQAPHWVEKERTEAAAKKAKSTPVTVEAPNAVQEQGQAMKATDET